MYMKYWQDEIFKLYTEAKHFEAGKYHPRFLKTGTEFRRKGASSAPRDAIHFLSNLLEYVGIFSEEETDSIVKDNLFVTKRKRFLELLEVHSEEIKSSADEIDEVYSPLFNKYFDVESANRGREGREEKYARNAAAIEIKQQQKEELQKLKSSASGDAGDALNVISNSLRNISDEVFGGADSFEVDSANPDTTISIKLKNSGFNSKVVNFLRPFVGDSKIDIDIDDSVWVWASPDSPIAKLVAKIGIDRVEDSIYDWIESNTSTSGVVEIVPPLDVKSISSMIGSQRPGRKRGDVLGPEKSIDDEDEVEYGSELPDVPKFPDEEDDRDYYRGSQRDEYGDDDVYTGGDEYEPRWAQEDEEEEHEGARRSPEEGEYDRPYNYDDDVYSDEADLNDDGELSEYEKKRDAAIKKANKRGEENNEAVKMSPQQVNQWMYMQRAQRMQNNLRQNERWGNY